MVHFPEGFIALKYPGYFWNIEESKLYSLKISGILKPLKIQSKVFVRGITIPKGYSISVNGRRMRVAEDAIKNLFVTNSTIPVI